jgi:hypothetical protein
MSKTRTLRSETIATGISPSRLPLPTRQPARRREALLPGPEPETTEVVTSRPASIMEEYNNSFIDPAGPEHHDVVIRPITDDEDNNSSSDESDKESRTSSRRKRAQSLDSAEKAMRDKVIGYLKPDVLSTEQKAIVDAANDSLTDEQKVQLRRRQEKMASKMPEGRSEPGPSKWKGKGIDLREYGNLNISWEELNPDTQAAIFRAIQTEINLKKETSKNFLTDEQIRIETDRGSRNKGNFPIPQVSRHQEAANAGHAQPTNLRRAASRPAAQIVRDSSLGVALGNVAEIHGDERNPDEPPEFPSDSDDDDFSDSSDDGVRFKKLRHHSKKRPRRRQSIIQPIPPKGYDGSVNSRDYHRFVMEGEAYLRDGKVHKERQIRVLAHYLDGKAYTFYMQKVASDDPRNWNLHKFFTELFNYCFPIDYRQRMRLKLEDLYQGSQQPVSEYVHELQELFAMVGAQTPESKVIKLWYTLRPKIQRIMWKDGLHPETSTWEEVVAKAEVIEIADHVIDPKDRRSVQTSSNNNNRNNNNSNNNTNNSERNSKQQNAGSTSAPRSKNNSSQKNNTNNNGQRNSQNQRRNQSNNQGQSGSQNKNPNQRTNTDGRSSNSGPFTKKKKNPFNLTDKEMSDLRADGRCFRCKGKGHLSHNCPDGQSVPGNGSGKPPGLPNYSMEMGLIENVDESSEVLDSMPVGMLDFQPNTASSSNCQPKNTNSDWRRYYPLWQSLRALARNQIGDCYAIAAEYWLTLLQPYPGDDLWNKRGGPASPETRFQVVSIPRYPGEYLIKDGFSGFEAIVSETKLNDAEFNLGYWYAEKLSHALGLKESITGHFPLATDSPIVLVTTCLLQNGIHAHFPNVDPDTDSETRFLVYPKDESSETFVIVDNDLGIRLQIDREFLENPKLDLITHYVKYASEIGRYHEKYISHHKHRYEPIPDGEEDLFADMPPLAQMDGIEGIMLNMTNAEDERIIFRIIDILQSCQPFPGDRIPVDPTYNNSEHRFKVGFELHNLLCIYDRVQGIEAYLLWDIASWDQFSIGKWFAERIAASHLEPKPWEIADEWIKSRDWCQTTLATENGYTQRPIIDGHHVVDLHEDDISDYVYDLDFYGIQVDKNKYVNIQRNAARVKDNHERLLPKPVVIRVNVNGLPVRALVDSGSLSDFISSTTVDQLKLKRTILDKPLGLQLAVQGSRSKINSFIDVNYTYQEINDCRRFDIANLNDYDVILGTPWLYQHQVCIGLNPARIVIGSNEPLPIMSGVDTKYLLGSASLYASDEVKNARTELMAYAEPLCRKVEETELPPLRAINHTIPLIDENKVYPWRPSRCPEIFREQWAEKRDAYIKSGRWMLTTARNTVPMLLIPKPHKPKDAQELRTVYDLRERNKNTIKLSSPLPDIDGVLRRVASKPFRTVLDLTAAYEQIRVIPEHVDRTAMTTPDGNMVSLVLQMGDCNAPATYQSLMNHIFSPYLSRFLDVYMDDIMVYSDTLENHVQHCKMAMDVLKVEKLYLSKAKLRILADELKLLGRIIDANGIRMDPEKVDCVLTWKTPTNRDLLRGFIGSVGYLADDIPNIRLPLGVLSALTGDTVPFRWTPTEQRAFDEAKRLTELARNHSRHPISYENGAPQVWMVTDGSATGIAGVVSQGDDWKTARVAAFYSAKLNNAQRNYPVHEIEMLAGVETMLRHRDILQGVHFKWITDHKGLIYLLNQKNISGRQARWLEKISSFIFEVIYAAGSENVLADALSRIYSNDSKGTERSRSEFTAYDLMDEEPIELPNDMTLLAGMEAVVATHRDSNKRDVLGAETGRPETAQEFASRVKGKFVLRGPRERTKGESGGPTTTNATKNNDATTITSERNTEQQDVDMSGNISESNIPETSLVNVILESDAGIDLLKSLRGQYKNDPIFKLVIEKPKDFRNFEVKDELIYLKLDGKTLLCIPKIMINNRNVHEIIISEAHSILAHLGPNKTLNYLRDHVWWKDIVSDTKAYCDTCVTCKRSKPNNQKPYGLLNPLAIPTEPWESIGIDFVGPLPLSSNRDGNFDSITVVICLLTAMVELIPSRINYKATEVAELMFESVYKHHGLPKSIVSDRDVLFTSTFWGHLHTLIGTKLKMSSAYHPQTDGATERANRTITQMLRQCIDPNQKDWVSKLPTVQFAINSARSESTGYAPFFLNTGRMPRAMIWNSPSPEEYSSVREFALKRKLALISAHDSVIGARIKQTRDANRKRQLVPFEEGDFVYLSTKNITFAKGLARKFIPKYIGPYKIIQDFNNQSFKLELPVHLKKRGIHNVFHSSLLRIHVPNDDRLFPGRMDTQIGESPDIEDEWAVEQIRSHAGSGEDSVFEIKWKSGDVTWMPYYQIKHLQAFDAYLELMSVNHISKLPVGKGKPPQEDLQIFLGAVSLGPPLSTPLRQSRSIIYVSPKQSLTFPFSPAFILDIILDFLFSSPFSFLSPFGTLVTSLIRDTLKATDPSEHLLDMSSGIQHPRFLRINDTEYVITNLDSPYKWYVHVGQIMGYLAFDALLREERDLADFPGIPLGYADFAAVFNTGTYPGDKRKFSTYLSSSAGDHITKSEHPLFLEDFHITSDQCGIPTARDDGLDDTHDFIVREYAKTQAYKNQRRQEEFKARRNKKANDLLSRVGSTTQNTKNRYDPMAFTRRKPTTSYKCDTFSRASTSQAPSNLPSENTPATSSATDIISRAISDTNTSANGSNVNPPKKRSTKSSRATDQMEE